ncbi:SOS response-associated peptidase [Gephyromycinifex aptenodytis]|uniref:SOS response-associated peptidase n=1 Tax=Gephyromycinifex aptenodytis TaxID=2716227 RepID=UPI0014451E72|nr:SOS response-associated peptidase [Gephyromycinifex aptenodytis]
MCGRYAASASGDELIQAMQIQEDHTGEPIRSALLTPQEPPPGAPDYNIAPSKAAHVVLTRLPRQSGTHSAQAEPIRQLRLLTWGLVPSWAEDPKVGVRMTNARAETALGKPSYRAAARSRRCLIPATGWYEWQVSPTAFEKGKPRKQPFFMHRSDDTPLTFAGFYEFWRDPSQDPADPLSWLTTFTIVTTAAEPGLDRIHDRQPLVLEPEHWATWLDPEVTDADTVAALLGYTNPGRFEAYPVDRRVGSSRANGPELLRPLRREELVGVIDPMTAEVLGE